MLANIEWGLRRGVAIALVYCAWVSAVYLLSGPTPFRTMGVSYGLVVLTYLAIGAGSGTLIGMLKPLTLHRLGGYVVGLVAAVPVAFGLAFCVSGAPKAWTAADWAAIPVFTIGWGL